MREHVFLSEDPDGSFAWSRYLAGGLADPAEQVYDGNATFERKPDRTRGGALVLHGLSDSPYSFRAIADILEDEGYYVLALRLPGHGTVPAALTDVDAEDWVAAVHFGIRMVRERIDVGRPLVLAGYSNGGTLATNYCVDALFDPSLPMPSQLILISPAIGLPAVAALSPYLQRVSALPGLGHFAWAPSAFEYEPFKYNSFPLNASTQIGRLSRELRQALAGLGQSKPSRQFPDVLTFTSLVDSTVRFESILSDLYFNLPEGNHELVVFDLNRFTAVRPFLTGDPGSSLESVREKETRNFDLRILTNGPSDPAGRMIERILDSDRSDWRVTPTLFHWPRGVFSLSHVAIPFRMDDPVYGVTESGLGLGGLEARGEIGVFRISGDRLMRLRYNPFFGLLEDRIRLELGENTDGS